MEESEWKKNFRMILAIDVRPFLEPSSGPCGDDILLYNADAISILIG